MITKFFIFLLLISLGVLSYADNSGKPLCSVIVTSAKNSVQSNKAAIKKQYKYQTIDSFIDHILNKRKMPISVFSIASMKAKGQKINQEFDRFHEMKGRFEKLSDIHKFISRDYPGGWLKYLDAKTNSPKINLTLKQEVRLEDIKGLFNYMLIHSATVSNFGTKSFKYNAEELIYFFNSYGKNIGSPNSVQQFLTNLYIGQSWKTILKNEFRVDLEKLREVRRAEKVEKKLSEARSLLKEILESGAVVNDLKPEVFKQEGSFADKYIKKQNKTNKITFESSFSVYRFVFRNFKGGWIEFSLSAKINIK